MVEKAKDDSLSKDSMSVSLSAPSSKKKSVAKKVFPVIEWTEERPRPHFIKNLWKPDVEEELVRYIDWHRRHPHCITPRPAEGNTLIGDQRYDEDDQTKYYIKTNTKVDPITDPMFLPNNTYAADGNISVATSKASKIERRNYLSLLKIDDPDEDPWFVMSVKDQLETSHIDGDHTTVKLKRKKTKAMSEMQKEIERKKIAFTGYAGGNMPVNEAQSKAIEQNSLKV